MKTLTIILIILLVLVIFYLNRTYANIFSYQDKHDLISAKLIRQYTLENGQGQQNLKYVALGDSLTYGLGATDYKNTYPYILGQKFLKNYQKVEVVNLAVSGAVVRDVLNLQLPAAIKENPQVVTLMIGTNDTHGFYNKDHFKTTYQEIISELKTKTKAKIILINIPYLGTEELIKPPYNTYFDLRIKEFNQVIAQVSRDNNLKYIDLYSLTRDRFIKNSDLYSVDQFHPSDKGYMLWGQLITKNAD